MSKKEKPVADAADDLPPLDEEEGPSQGWLATFADLMALLMCFFVLLLSFSEIDVQKYKQVAGSMKFAFGVQRDIKAEEIPKAESIIKEEFSPGKPEPTVFNVIRQQTADEMRRVPRDPSESTSAEEALAALAQQIREKLADELDDEALELLVGEDGIMIRVREKDAFPSGSARLQAGFRPVLDKLVSVLNGMQGSIVVSGHTDNLPIDTRAFPSELGAVLGASGLGGPSPGERGTRRPVTDRDPRLRGHAPDRAERLAREPGEEPAGGDRHQRGWGDLTTLGPSEVRGSGQTRTT